MTTRDEYVASIKQAFFTLGKEAALDYIRGQLPFLTGQVRNKYIAFLGVHLANPLAGWIVGLTLESLVTKAETAAFFLYIDMRVGAQGKDFEAAAFANYQAQRQGTDVEKQNAEKNLKAAFHRFATYAS